MRCIYMQERFLRSLIPLLFLWCDVFTCKNVLYTHSYILYSHGCNVFIHARTFFMLPDTTSIPMGAMYLHARMFCTLAHTSSIPMGEMYLCMHESFLHSMIPLLFPYMRYICSTCKNVLYTHSYIFYSYGCNVFTCKNVLYARSFIFYSHGCNVFIHARMFFYTR